MQAMRDLQHTIKDLSERLANLVNDQNTLAAHAAELITIGNRSYTRDDAVAALGEQLDLRRVCVHSDTWAAAVTLNDRQEEELALTAGRWERTAVLKRNRPDNSADTSPVAVATR